MVAMLESTKVSSLVGRGLDKALGLGVEYMAAVFVERIIANLGSKAFYNLGDAASFESERETCVTTSTAAMRAPPPRLCLSRI